MGCLFDLHDPACFSLFLLVSPSPEDDIALALATLTIAHAVRDKDLDELAVLVEEVLPNTARVWHITDSDSAPSDTQALLWHCETWFGSTQPRGEE